LQNPDLANRRRALGLTQRELAGRFGVSRQSLNAWERRRVRVPNWYDDQLRWLEEMALAHRAGEKVLALPWRRQGVKGLRRGPYNARDTG